MVNRYCERTLYVMADNIIQDLIYLYKSSMRDLCFPSSIPFIISCIYESVYFDFYCKINIYVCLSTSRVSYIIQLTF